LCESVGSLSTNSVEVYEIAFFVKRLTLGVKFQLDFDIYVKHLLPPPTTETMHAVLTFSAIFCF